MVRLLALASLVTIIGSFSVPVKAANHPYNLGWLFGLSDKNASESKDERPVCKTEECKLIAQQIKQSMDDTVDPCDDFYEYACGNWPNNNPIPEDEDTWSLWYQVSEKIKIQIKHILEGESKPDDILAVKLARKWYNSCMDTDAMEERGLEPLLTTLSRHGGWPMIMEPDEWDEDAYTWQKVDDYYAFLTGKNALHDIRVVDAFDGSGQLLVVHTPHLPPGSYSLWSGKHKHDDDDESNEDEQSEEDSQEKGSEDKTEEDSEDEEEDSEGDDDLSVRKNKLAKRKSSRVSMRSKRKGHGNKISRKRIAETKRGKRIKRKAAKVRVHKKTHTEGKERKLSRRKSNGGKRRVIKTSKSKDIHKIHGRVQNKNKRNNEHSPSKNRKVHHSKNVAVERNRYYDDGESEDYDDYSEDDEVSKGDEDSTVEEDDENDENDEDDEDDESEESSGDDEDSEDDGDDEDDEDDNDSEDDSDEDSDEEIAKKHRAEYAAFVLNVTLALSKARGVELSRKKLEKDIEDMIDFQIQLFELTTEDDDYENTTLGEFQESYDSLDPKTANGKVNWVKKIRKLFDEAGVEVDDDTSIISLCSEYMDGLQKLLDETPSETIVNYIHWNFISRMIEATTKELIGLFNSWKDIDDDDAEMRAKRCIEQVEMTDIVGYEYVKQYFSDDLAKTALDMIDDIQKEVEYQIKESKWLDENTRDFILDKLVNLNRLVGYPDWYRNSTFVKRYFRGLIVGPSYFENVLSYLRYYRRQGLRRLVQQHEDDTWLVDPMTLNAFFIPHVNSITITAADFQHPLFAYHRPQGINFAIIGFVMAHEVNHGFDDTGHLYDKNGKVMEWLSAMAEAYNRRAECFVDQFDGYSIVKGKNVTIEHYGNQTAGENIADTMGLQAVYKAYKRRESKCGQPDPALPGLEHFSNDQLFFLSFANLWCEATDPETIAERAEFDEHSTDRLRVIGSVSNSEDFAKAFHCPLGSPMNPQKKCNIWN